VVRDSFSVLVLAVEDGLDDGSSDVWGGAVLLGLFWVVVGWDCLLVGAGAV
jgi:hypothetical protein